MNIVKNAKLQALLDMYSVVGFEAIRSCGMYDELTCDEQMQLEQLIED